MQCLGYLMLKTLPAVVLPQALRSAQVRRSMRSTGPLSSMSGQHDPAPAPFKEAIKTRAVLFDFDVKRAPRPRGGLLDNKRRPAVSGGFQVTFQGNILSLHRGGRLREGDVPWGSHAC